MNEARQFVRQAVEAEKLFAPSRPGWYSRFWAKARVGNTRRLTTGETRYVRKLEAISDDAEANQCFHNAQALIMRERMLRKPRLRYWEGYFQHADMLIPVMHAWLTINGAVYDPTLAPNRAKHGDSRGKAEYFGIEIPFKDMAANSVKTRRFCSSLEESEFLRGE